MRGADPTGTAPRFPRELETTMQKLSHGATRANDKPLHRKRFALIDLAMIDENLLYSDSSGSKKKLGLLLETERATDGTFLVRQAAPEKLTRRGVEGQIVGRWKFLHRRWTKNGKGH
jgi:hypothetical protein